MNHPYIQSEIDQHNHILLKEKIERLEMLLEEMQIENDRLKGNFRPIENEDQEKIRLQKVAKLQLSDLQRAKEICKNCKLCNDCCFYYENIDSRGCYLQLNPKDWDIEFILEKIDAGK